MGTYLNPGNILFQECTKSKIYVDKTGLIEYTNEWLNTENKFVCVSRPRRFGKSMSLKMLAAYYSRECDSRGLFEPYKISRSASGDARSGFAKNLNQYDTLLIDMQGLLGSALNEPQLQKDLEQFYQKLPQITDSQRATLHHPLLTGIQHLIIRDLRENKTYAAYIPETEASLGNALLTIYKNTGSQFVLLIDEWDCVFRNYETDRLLQDKYIGFLRDLFKNTALLPVFALVYLTGILPIRRYGTQSALNNFTEYTFLNPMKLAEFSGFTEPEVRGLCADYHIDFEEMSRWYNGYAFKRTGRIYNPRSVVCAIENEEFASYWTATGTYESVKKVIDMNFDGLKEKIILMLGNGRCKINVSKFQNDMVTFHSCDDVLTLLVHLGYLGYDSEKKEVYIPNREIRDEFVNAIDGNKWTLTHAAIMQSEELLEATLSCDEQTVAACIEKVHENNTAILTYNSETALSCVIQLAYYQAQDHYMLVREMPAGKGFADVVFLPRRGSELPALVIELKWLQTARTALDQIRERHYGDVLHKYYGDLLLVAISYDKESGTKQHHCIIERIRKD